MDKKIQEKGIEFKSHVLTRINELKAGLHVPQNWANQSSRELRKLEALLESLDNIFTYVEEDYLQELDEDHAIHHQDFINTA